MSGFFADFCSRLVRRQFGGLFSVRANAYGSKHSKAGRREETIGSEEFEIQEFRN